MPSEANSVLFNMYDIFLSTCRAVTAVNLARSAWFASGLLPKLKKATPGNAEFPSISSCCNTEETLSLAKVINWEMSGYGERKKVHGMDHYLKKKEREKSCEKE